MDNAATGTQTGKSWTDAWTTLTALPGLSPGDTVYISGGASGSEKTYTLAGSWKPKGGTLGHPISYRIGQDSQHNGTAIFHTDAGGRWLDAQVSAGGALHDIVISGDAGDGRSHLKLSGYRTVFSVNNGSFHLLNWYVGYVDFGSLSTCGSLINVNKVELAYCRWKIDDLKGNGAIMIDFRGTTWGDNRIHHCDVTAPNDGYGGGVDFIQGGTSGVSVHDNTFTGYATSAYAGTQHQDGWQPLGGTYLEAYNNVFRNIANYALFFEAYYGGFSHIRIYNNIIVNTLPSLQASAAPRGIVIVPTAGASLLSRLTAWPVFDDILVANNTICDLGRQHAAIQIQNQTASQYCKFTNCFAYNNLGVNGGAFNFDPAVRQANNLTVTAAEAAGLFVRYSNLDPANDLTVSSLSRALLGTGTNLSTFFTIAIDGLQRPAGAGWDIGAFPQPSESPAAMQPTLTGQPTSGTAVAGATVSLTVSATGSPAPTFQWLKNGTALSGQTTATLKLMSVTTANVGTYTVVATNSAGSVTSTGAVLTVTVPPAFTTQPTGGTVAAGTTVTFTAVASGTPAPTYQWLKNGTAISGQTGATLKLTGITTASAGTYSVVAKNSAGSVTSKGAALTVTVPPAFTTQPTGQTVTAGATVTFVAAASGTPSPQYQWKKDGAVLSGATSATLKLSEITSAQSGSYTVVASNSTGTVTSRAAVLNLNPVVVVPPAPSTPTTGTGTGTGPATPPAPGPSDGYLTNLSLRAAPGTDTSSLIVGFVTTTGDKRVLLRSVGPGLPATADLQAFANPSLTLYAGDAVTASNVNWGGTTLLREAFVQVGAFPLPSQSADAAILITLAPRAYTAIVSGTGTGVVLTEIYDADTTRTPANRIVNLSARAHVGTGDDVMIAGFVIGGETAVKLLLRAVGPSLGKLGVTSLLADPQLELYRNGTRLQLNDNWGGDQALTTAFAQTGAFPLSSASSKDAALLVTLDPGAYTVVASGTNGTTGNALVEVYEVR